MPRPRRTNPVNKRKAICLTFAKYGTPQYEADRELVLKLQTRAAENHRSVSAEVRYILRASLAAE